MAVVNLDEVAGYVDVPPAARILLEKPEREMRLTLSIRMEDDSLACADTFVVYHNTARGPAKGGIRMQPDVTLAETAELAELMTWKTALMGVPFGGGKSAIKLDPHRFNRPQRAEVIREYVHILRFELGSGSYIPAPDMGTSEHEMAIIFGETHVLECVTGKPPRVGGLPGRREATGRGLATCIAESVDDILGMDSHAFTVAIQGFGNVGSWTAKFLSDAGRQVIAISDETGCALREDGLDVDGLMAWTAEGRDLCDYPEAEQLPRDDLLGLEVDVLVPAAVGHVFTEQVARRVRAKMVVEGANAPTPAEGDRVFAERGIPVVPDILANSGGVIASYVEWRKAKSGSLTPESETFATLDQLVHDGLHRVIESARGWNTSFRTAALALAVEEVVHAMADRGWF